MMRNIPLNTIQLSKTNPRRRRDEKADAELVESVRRHGVLQPVLVRPSENGGTAWELVVGSRRFTAAKAAGLTEIPAIEKDLSDVEALEVQVVENLQRADVHPIEEAEGYRQLSSKPGYDVATVAERVGRSVKYVYDRMKLLALTKEAKQLFLEDRITAGHAILLARLKPSEQARAIEARDGLFQDEHTLWDPEVTGRQGSTKVRSVRELQAWIDANVRFDAKAPDPMLFPETAEEVAKAQKIVPITFSHYIPPEARDGKTFGPRSWKRADGELKSKRCELSTTGVVMVGPHRGEAFAVCVAKEKCSVHWGAEIRERKKRAAQAPAASPGTKGQAPQPKQEDPKLLEAIRAAQKVAGDEVGEALDQAVAKLSPTEFIRFIGIVWKFDLRRWLQEHGEKVTGASAIENWIKAASLPKLQRAILDAIGSYANDDDIEGALGVDGAAIYARHEKQAREEHKAAQTSAPAKAKPARARKAGTK